MAGDQTITIGSRGDVRAAPEHARVYARRLGFERAEAEDIALVVREMALNVLHHGGGGALALREVDDGERRGLEVEADNPGPAIPDVEEAFRDGHSTRGGFGYGLGTVNRKMHSVEVHSPRADGSGTLIVARRWLYRNERPPSAHLDAGIASRPRRTLSENGDAVAISSWGDRSLVAVIDGIGHGVPAMKASRAARGYVADHSRESLVSIFRGVHRACRGTRGVVMAIVRFHWDEGSVTVGNVGNVEIRTFGTRERMGFLVRRGFLGRRAIEPAVRSATWPTSATMILHTDGIRGSGLAESYRGLEDLDPRRVARTLLSRLHDERDDGTIAVLRRRDA